MEIPRDPNPIDPLARRRAAEGAKRAGGKPSTSSTSSSGDAVATPGTEAVGRYLAMLKAHQGDPAKLEALRQQLENGTFTATPEELVDPLLDQLDKAGG